MCNFWGDVLGQFSHFVNLRIPDNDLRDSKFKPFSREKLPKLSTFGWPFRVPRLFLWLQAEQKKSNGFPSEALTELYSAERKQITHLQ